MSSIFYTNSFLFIRKHGLFLLSLLAVSWLLFGWLDWMPLRHFDESRLANNALEMYENGNWIVTHYDSRPDMWNTKPPLLIWIQCLWLKMNGISHTSIRIPSAIFGLLTFVLLYFFSYRYLQSRLIGLVSGLGLMTNLHYLLDHGARSGDYEATLIFFITLNFMSFYRYIESNAMKYYVLFLVSLIMAAMTKGIVPYILMLGYMVYMIYRRKNIRSFGMVILAIVVSLMVLSSYYLYRESINSGYIQALVDNEWLGRYMTALEGHDHPFYYYIEHIIYEELPLWWVLFLASLLLLKTRYKNLIVLIWIVILEFLIIISSSQSKLNWYDLPIVPFFIIAGTIFLSSIIPLFSKKIYYTVIVLFLATLYINAFVHIYLPRVTDYEYGHYALALFLQDRKEIIKKYPNVNIQWRGYKSHYYFHSKVLQYEGYSVNINLPIQKGQYILTDERGLLDSLYKAKLVRNIFSDKGVDLLFVQ